VDSVPDPLLLRKSGRAGNRNLTSESVAGNSDHWTTEAVDLLIHANIFQFCLNSDEIKGRGPRRHTRMSPRVSRLVPEVFIEMKNIRGKGSREKRNACFMFIFFVHKSSCFTDSQTGKCYALFGHAQEDDRSFPLSRTCMSTAINK
jgi:hypothetical protein